MLNISFSSGLSKGIVGILAMRFCSAASMVRLIWCRKLCRSIQIGGRVLDLGYFFIAVVPGYDSAVRSARPGVPAAS